MEQYSVIGLMSGSSLDGIDIAHCLFQKENTQWSFSIKQKQCFEWDEEIKHRVQHATQLAGKDLSKLHADLGKYFGELVYRFIQHYSLQGKVNFIASHGHTVFHYPENNFTTQIGDGAQIAAQTGLPAIVDFRTKDVAFGGNGAPVVPIGERHLFNEHILFLNIGGIANVSFHNEGKVIAFDICAANQALNYLAQQAGQPFDEGGKKASIGTVDEVLLQALNDLSYYKRPFPKSLDNSFCTDQIIPLLEGFTVLAENKLATYCEHIAIQIKNSLEAMQAYFPSIFITGGGAFNNHLVNRIGTICNVEVVVPGNDIVEFKEALIIAFMGVLRWKNEVNVLKSVTGAREDSVNGAIYV